MIILTPIKCEQCEADLQSENIGVSVNCEGELVRICLFCGNEVIIK